MANILPLNFRAAHCNNCCGCSGGQVVQSWYDIILIPDGQFDMTYLFATLRAPPLLCTK